MRPTERRTFRVPARVPVRWLKKPTPVESTATDIGVHGMFLEGIDETELGRLLKIEVLLPSGPIVMFVVARHVGLGRTGPGAGVEIFVISPKNYGRWRDFYAEQLVQYFDRCDAADVDKGEATGPVGRLLQAESGAR